MIRFAFALAVLLSVAAPLARAAGFQRIEVPGGGSLPPLRGAVWYPCAEPPSPTKIGPFVLDVAENCPVAGDKLPLVVISHGRTGSFLGHLDTAETLADAGFVVVAINHPGDNALDRSRSDDPAIFIERPADIKRAIDFMLGPWPFSARIDADRIGFFGFSRGGYTGLVAIGANPSLDKVAALCRGASNPICDGARSGRLPELTHDPRIKAAVIADPLGIFFASDSFGSVRAPVQLWSSERGGDGVTPENVADIGDWLPTKPEFHVAPNSAHFAFLAPCPGELVASAPEICADGPGFDRAAFHQKFNAGALAFFRTHLVDAGKPE